MVIERHHLFFYIANGGLTEVHMHGLELRYRGFSGVHILAPTRVVSIFADSYIVTLSWMIIQRF